MSRTITAAACWDLASGYVYDAYGWGATLGCLMLVGVLGLLALLKIQGR